MLHLLSSLDFGTESYKRIQFINSGFEYCSLRRYQITQEILDHSGDTRCRIKKLFKKIEKV